MTIFSGRKTGQTQHNKKNKAEVDGQPHSRSYCPKGDRCIMNRAQLEGITHRAVPHARQDLRRHELRGPKLPGHDAVAHLASGIEIDELDAGIVVSVGEKHVARLDVAMHDTLIVDKLDRG